MKHLAIYASILFLSACGGQSNQDGNTVVNSCEEAADCDCETEETASCADGICHCTETITETETIEITVDPETSLLVSLSQDTAESSTLPQGATQVHLASFDFTAVGGDLYVHSLNITRGGVGQMTDWVEMAIYNGADLLAQSGIDYDNSFPFEIRLLVAENETVSLDLLGDVSSSPGPSNQHYFAIESTEFIVSNADAVTGEFPVAGTTFVMAGVANNTITIQSGTSPAQPVVGASNTEVGDFRLIVGSVGGVELSSITLTNCGTLPSFRLSNLRLVRGTDEVATAAEFVGNQVTFDLAQPFMTDADDTSAFYVYADITGGAAGDTIALHLDETSDMDTLDLVYGFGTQIENNFSCSEANVLTLSN